MTVWFYSGPTMQRIFEPCLQRQSPENGSISRVGLETFGDSAPQFAKSELRPPANFAKASHWRAFWGYWDSRRPDRIGRGGRIRSVRWSIGSSEVVTPIRSEREILFCQP